MTFYPTVNTALYFGGISIFYNEFFDIFLIIPGK